MIKNNTIKTKQTELGFFIKGVTELINENVELKNVFLLIRTNHCLRQTNPLTQKAFLTDDEYKHFVSVLVSQLCNGGFFVEELITVFKTILTKELLEEELEKNDYDSLVTTVSLAFYNTIKNYSLQLFGQGQFDYNSIVEPITQKATGTTRTKQPIKAVTVFAEAHKSIMGDFLVTVSRTPDSILEARSIIDTEGLIQELSECNSLAKKHKLIHGAFGEFFTPEELMLTLGTHKFKQQFHNSLIKPLFSIRQNRELIDYDSITINSLLTNPMSLLLVRELPTKLLTGILDYPELKLNSIENSRFFLQDSMEVSRPSAVIEEDRVKKKRVSSRVLELDYSLKDQLALTVLLLFLQSYSYRQSLAFFKPNDKHSELFNALVFFELLPFLEKEQSDFLFKELDYSSFLVIKRNNKRTLIKDLNVTKLCTTLAGYSGAMSTYGHWFFYRCFRIVTQFYPGTVQVPKKLCYKFLSTEQTIAEYCNELLKEGLLCQPSFGIGFLTDETRLNNELIKAVLFATGFYPAFYKKDKKRIKELLEWVLLNVDSLFSAHEVMAQVALEKKGVVGQTQTIKKEESSSKELLLTMINEFLLEN